MDPKSGHAGLEYQNSTTNTNHSTQGSAHFSASVVFQFHHNSAGLLLSTTGMLLLLLLHFIISYRSFPGINVFSCIIDRAG
jgi:hypothetical protein